MKLQRSAGMLALVAVAAVALSACGTDNNAGDGAPSSAGSSSSSSVTCPSGSVTINAEGSTAQKNAIDQVVSDYQAACPDVTVNYNPTGSGAGIKQFVGGQVDFAGSDSALNADKGEVDQAAARCNAPAWDLPMVTGPIAIAYSLKGVDDLVLNGDVAAQIFHGKITKWNDPAIAALNPNATLPDEPIHVFFRSDESGTTENFTKYLSTVAPTVWTDAPAKSWPSTATGEGREKSSGVAEGVKSTEGSISYVEWSYARDNQLDMAAIDTGSGTPVKLTADSASAAVNAATKAGDGNDLRLNLDYGTKAEGAYPIILVTYEIVCSSGLDQTQTDGVKSFLSYFASDAAQKNLVDLGYAPLPANISADVRTAIDAIK